MIWPVEEDGGKKEDMACRGAGHVRGLCSLFGLRFLSEKQILREKPWDVYESSSSAAVLVAQG